MSAKYKLLHLDDIIEPYNLTLNDFKEKERKEWADEVIKRCEEEGIKKDDEIIFLVGNNYRKYLEKYFTNSSCPISNMTFGYILEFLSTEISKKLQNKKNILF